MEEWKTGVLLNPDNIIKIQRPAFKQMVKLLGIRAGYRKPIPGAKQYNLYGELDAHFEPMEMVGCIYDTHPSQATMQKLGWNAEIADGTTIIHVPYDLDGLQAGCLFFLPSGIDDGKSRMYKVLRMSTIAVYPASIACELGPVLNNTTEAAVAEDFKTSNFNLLDGEQEEYGY